MSTLYHTDGYQKEVYSKIISLFKHDGRNCVQLESDIFYPQGGGQKGDIGILIIEEQEFSVINTVKDPYGSNDAVMLTETEIPNELINSTVKAILNWEFRYAQMKLHTCVHLHHCMIEEVIGTSIQHPKTSSIEDGFAYNKYQLEDNFDMTVIDKANIKFYEFIKKETLVTTYPDVEKEGYRWWECLGYKIPCGGVHVKKLNEIGDVLISKSNKKGTVTIKFTLK